jgi:hypothetical protein
MKLGIDVAARRPPQQIMEIWQTIMARIGVLPGVRSVGAVTHLPLSREESTSTLT